MLIMVLWFFFFLSKTKLHLISKRKESRYKVSKAGGGESSNQTISSLRCLAKRAKECATPLAAQQIPQNSTRRIRPPKQRISSYRFPKRDQSSWVEIIDLITFELSPSTIKSENPASKANSIASQHAKTSASSLSVTASTFDDKATITCPLAFWIIAPTPKAEVSVKIAASKLSLYIRPSGGCHACDNPTETRIVSCDWASLYSSRKLPAQAFKIPGSCRIPPYTTRLCWCHISQLCTRKNSKTSSSSLCNKFLDKCITVAWSISPFCNVRYEQLAHTSWAAAHSHMHGLLFQESVCK